MPLAAPRDPGRTQIVTIVKLGRRKKRTKVTNFVTGRRFDGSFTRSFLLPQTGGVRGHTRGGRIRKRPNSRFLVVLRITHL